MPSEKSIEQHWQDAHDAFVRLQACLRVQRDELPMSSEGKGGVYVFFDQDGSTLYVGRGRNVRQRILQHSRPSIKDGLEVFAAVKLNARHNSFRTT